MADREEIRRQLEKLEPRAAAAVGLRAAMRVFPLLGLRGAVEKPFTYWQEQDRSGHALNILRCYQVAIFVNSLPKIGSTAAAAAAAAATDAYATTVTAAAYTAAADVAHAAAHAAHAAAAAGTTDAAADACDAAEAATDYIAAPNTAFATDVHLAATGANIRPLLTGPLWQGGMPGEIDNLWRTLQQDLLACHDNYEVWINWYRARLRGWPLNMELERKWALLPDDILKLHPAEINSHLDLLRSEYLEVSDDTGDAPSDIPEEQEPGL